MGQLNTESRQRLALLLTAGTSRCRRLVAATPDGELSFHHLSRTRQGSVLVRAAEAVGGDAINALLAGLASTGWRWMTPGDAGYPSLLCQLSDSPLGLFVAGEIPSGAGIAIVGARSASAYGVQATQLLAREAAAVGVTVVSGMALGIDTAAHEAALAAGGATVAVWGTGPDTVYPPKNRGLAERIPQHGALITEYPPGTPARRYHFPQRNRLIAGMVSGVVVVEAGVRSGALITARQALDEGRDVFAVPGSIFSELSLGPNALIRAGARPVLTPADVLEELANLPLPARGCDDSKKDEGVLRLIPRGESVSVDDLASKLGQAIPRVLNELLELELAAKIRRRTDGRYCRL